MRDLASTAALKILSISRAIKRGSTPKAEAPEVKVSAISPEPVASVQAPATGPGELPPMNEAPLDQAITLGGGDAFDSLLGASNG